MKQSAANSPSHLIARTYRPASAGRVGWAAAAFALCLTAALSCVPTTTSTGPIMPPPMPPARMGLGLVPWCGSLVSGMLQPRGGVLPPAAAFQAAFDVDTPCPQHRTNQAAAFAQLDGVVVWPGKPVSLVADVFLPLRPEAGFCIGPVSSGAVACLGAGAEDIMPVVVEVADRAGLSATRRALTKHARLLLPFAEDTILEARDRAAYYIRVSSTDRRHELRIFRQPLGQDACVPAATSRGTATAILPARVTIGVVGDIMPAGSVCRLLADGARTYLRGPDSLLQSVDIALANLEAPLTTSAAATPLKTRAELSARREFVFKAEPEPSLALLRELGIDAVSIANNHILDYQAQGLSDTKAHLRAAGIASTGAGSACEARRPARVAPGTLSCGLLSYAALETLPRPASFAARPHAPGIALIGYDAHGPSASTRAMLAADIKALAEDVDIVVVAFHWGDEGSATLRPGQRELAHFCIDQGADFIWGHHPHRIQPVELYRGKPIAYSMGNFVFDCPPHRHLLRSGVLVTCFDTRGLVAASLIPAAVGSRPGNFGSRVPGIPMAPASNVALASELRRDLGFAH